MGSNIKINNNGNENSNFSTIKNNKIKIGIGSTIIVIGFVLVFIFLRKTKVDVMGKWLMNGEEVIEFMKDGTIYTGHAEMNPDTYEIVDENTMKIGRYDEGWIQYKYYYYDMKYSKDEILLTQHGSDDVDITLTRQ